MSRQRISAIVAILLVATAAMFAIGVAIERNAEADHEAAEVSERAPSSTATPQPSIEPMASAPDATHDESVPHDESEPHDEAAERDTSAESKDRPGAAESSEEEPHSETGENGHAEGEEGDAHTDAPETLFGIDVESPGLVALGVAASVAVAALVWFRRGAPMLLVAAAFSLGFAVLDVRELLHQLDEHRALLTLLAGSVALGHLAVAVLGVTGARSRS